MNKAHITGEHPVVAEVRMARPYRAALIVSFTFLAIAALIGSLVIVGPARDAAHHSAQIDATTRLVARETLCRAKIADAVSAAAIENGTAQSDYVLALGDPAGTKDTKAASRSALQAAKDLNDALADIRRDATQICHLDPDYHLPDNLTNPGGTPP